MQLHLNIGAWLTLLDTLSPFLPIPDVYSTFPTLLLITFTDAHCSLHHITPHSFQHWDKLQYHTLHSHICWSFFYLKVHITWILSQCWKLCGVMWCNEQWVSVKVICNSVGEVEYTSGSGQKWVRESVQQGQSGSNVQVELKNMLVVRRGGRVRVVSVVPCMPQWRKRVIIMMNIMQIRIFLHNYA